MKTSIFEQQLQLYAEHLRIRKRSEQTIQGYNQCIRMFFNWITENRIYDLKDVTYDRLKEYQLMLMKKAKKYLSINTIHKRILTVKQLFTYLEKTHILLYNPAEKLVLPNLGDRLPKVIPTVKEIEKLLRSPNTGTYDGIRDRAMLELLYSSGIRRAECANLKVYDVDYKGGYLRVNQGKGGKDRILPLGKKACDWLKEYILKVRPHFVRNNPDERNLLVTNYGAPLSAQSLILIVRKYSQRAKIRRLTPHALRRGFATHMLKNGVNPVYIQRLLGHTNTEILNRYVKVAGIDVKKTHKKTHPRERDTR